MNGDETTNAIDVMQAWLDGGPIQYREANPRLNTVWTDLTGNPLWNWDGLQYRIKPEPREFWTNLYRLKNGTHEFCASYDSREAAEEGRSFEGGETIHVREVIE